MSGVRPRVSAWQPPPVRPAVPWANDPAARLAGHFQTVRETAMAGLPFLNEALEVTALPFRRVAGDWLGVVLTPWFLHVYLVPGGGDLWQDLGQGLRRRVALPAGELEFIGEDDPELGPLQYCVLLAPVPQFSAQADALQAAGEALETLLTAPPPAPVAADATPPQAESDEAGMPDARRRGFLRGFLGRP